jgi:L,D-transpeptidase YcbB
MNLDVFLKRMAISLMLLTLFSPQIATGKPLSVVQELRCYVTELQGQDWFKDTNTHEEQWLCDVYQDADFSPFWIENNGLSNRGRMIFEKLLTAEGHGLNPKDYEIPEIRELLKTKENKQLAQLDVLLTEGILRFIYDISEGRIQAQRAFPRLFAEAGSIEFDAGNIMEEIRSTLHLREYLDRLGPQHAAYKNLRKTLVDYRLLAKLGGWPKIAKGKILYPKGEDSRVPSIQQLLVVVGDLSAESATGNLFNEQTVDAVRQFQHRHGLKEDGVVGKETLAAMNISIDDRIQQIKLNLERWRWLDQSLGEKYVLVNIAGFALKAVKNDNILLEMPIIVGTLHHESPVFSDRIRYAEFNPFWNLTPSIARNETLRNLQSDPNYLASMHIRVFSSWQKDAVELDPLEIDWHNITPKVINRYKFRQDPGKWNALGTMKFVFPNKYAVYLHDTPNHELFKTSSRAYSHGCIRLSDPEGLAVFLMGGQANKWDRVKVRDIVASGKRKVVLLPERIPVHLTYLTSWYAMDGLLHFNKDIYQRDKKLLMALTESR